MATIYSWGSEMLPMHTFAGKASGEKGPTGRVARGEEHVDRTAIRYPHSSVKLRIPQGSRSSLGESSPPNDRENESEDPSPESIHRDRRVVCVIDRSSDFEVRRVVDQQCLMLELLDELARGFEVESWSVEGDARALEEKRIIPSRRRGKSIVSTTVRDPSLEKESAYHSSEARSRRVEVM